MKDIIKDLIKKSLKKIDKDKNISIEDIEVSLCKDNKFGDFSSNIAMKFSHVYNSSPRDLAKKILENISDNKNILKAICKCKKVAYCNDSCLDRDLRFHSDKCSANADAELE